jgi:serine/threonine protein phosphatase PrpC
MDYATAAIIGDRQNQEDYGRISYRPKDLSLLAVVCDGIGGNNAGEVASRTATDEFHRSFPERKIIDIPVALRQCLDASNSAISIESKRAPSSEGLGCTLVAAFLIDNRLYWISVGDSLLFVIRGGNLHRKNEDHSMAPIIEKSKLEGKITAEEAANHPHRNALRSALSGDRIELIDCPSKPIELVAGDIVILATDGLLTLSNEEIHASIAKHRGEGAESICSALLKAVRAKGKPRQDNTLVQVIIPEVSMSFKLRTEIAGPFGRAITLLAVVATIVIGALAGYFLQDQYGNNKAASHREDNHKAVESEVKLRERLPSVPTKQISLGESEANERTSPKLESDKQNEALSTQSGNGSEAPAKPSGPTSTVKQVSTESAARINTNSRESRAQKILDEGAASKTKSGTSGPAERAKNNEKAEDSNTVKKNTLENQEPKVPEQKQEAVINPPRDQVKDSREGLITRFKDRSGLDQKNNDQAEEK